MSQADYKSEQIATSVDFTQWIPALPCPSCGRCPACGRGGLGGRDFSPYIQPYQPWNPLQPYWGSSTISSAGSNPDLSPIKVTYGNSCP